MPACQTRAAARVTGAGDVLEFDKGATGNVAPIDTSDNLVISDPTHDTLYEFASTARGPSNPLATLHGWKVRR